MSARTPFNRIRHLLTRFGRARGGNVAILFGICIVPILGFVGAAIDFSRASLARSNMQGALDSAALMVSKDAAGTVLDQAELDRRVNLYFKALFTNGDVSGLTISASLIADPKTGSRLKISTSGKIHTEFLKVVGFPDFDIGAATATTWGGSRMRVAMALDVTGSMNSSGKLDEMKKSARDLIDTLQQTAKQADDVYISIVPFSEMVNVGTDNKNAAWLRWDLYDAEFNDLRNDKSFCKSMNCGNPRSNWSGCVTDRDEPADVTRVVATNNATRFPTMISSDNQCVAKIVPMTSVYKSTDVKMLKDSISALSATGGTNQPIGMSWAWLTMQSNGPFSTPAKDANLRYTDAIIVLSDGQNTKSRRYGNGYSYAPQVDARQKLLCDNIRASSDPASPVQIFTIQVNTTNDPESQVLKYCADPGSFFQTTSASGIADAFQQIGASLNKLRIAE